MSNCLYKSIIRMDTFVLNDSDKKLIELSLKEDLGEPFCDLTTEYLMSDAKSLGCVEIISKHKTPITVCGTVLIEAILSHFATHYTLKIDKADGVEVLPGERLLSITAPMAVLSMTERTILNYLRHLSAIATLTNQFVTKIQHTSTRILDTRKTTPGFRHLEKYAVRCGGGVNHRMGLYDAIMVKDTHVDMLGGMAKVMAKLAKAEVPTIVEVRNEEELEIVLEKGLGKVNQVLLDNMSILQLINCVNLCRGKIITEASGNLSLDNIVAVAETGVDFASVGRLTHSAGQVDLSMRALS